MRLPLPRPPASGRLAAVLLVALACSCARRGPVATLAPPGAVPATRADDQLLPAERAHLADLRQLTFGGENAEAYWSFDGQELSFQARHQGEECDRIYRTSPADVRPRRVSAGRGAATCAHFFPDGGLLFASTHLGGDACPPRPDMSAGYVWALYPDYDIFALDADAREGEAPRRLTTTPGYDAEGTVCARDGSVLFTSVRDGDLELYRMGRDGGNVRRLTHAAGYDGGAFFNADCTRIVWRASRPRQGRELDDYKELLSQGLVRPSKLEIWTANADGSDPTQLTYLNAASFAPSFHPKEDLILFSSNQGDPAGREFDLWAVRSNGSDLTRITSTPGFDGFPHFSPDGTQLAFSSNRATAPGKRDTNLFVARWRGLGTGSALERSEDRIARDVRWLADVRREGRGVGTSGLAQAGAWLENQLRAMNVAPGTPKGFRDPFPVVTAARPRPGNMVTIGDRQLRADEYAVLGFSASGKTQGPLVMASYGIVDDSQKIDDYRDLDVKGKIVLVRRFAPEGGPYTTPADRRRAGDLRRKAWFARERGARALIVVDWPAPPTGAPPGWQPPTEAPLLAATVDSPGDGGIPVLMVKRAAVATVLTRLAARETLNVTLDVGLVRQSSEAFNVIGRITAGKGANRGTVVIGAHYDHLGFGGRFSMAPGARVAHVGADDNASGTAALLEVARRLAPRRDQLSRDVVIAFFSGEESGLLGSSHYTRAQGAALRATTAMINLDMVGRLRDNRVDVLGSESATEWKDLLEQVCAAERVTCTGNADGYGPSDQAAFFAAGIPVLHFFTGVHSDYHKPTDTPDKVNAAGAAVITRLVEGILFSLGDRAALTFKTGSATPTAGDARSFNASLGTIPDYAGPPGGVRGVLLAGVRSGGAAERAGLRRGDVLLRLGPHEVGSVDDLMFTLNEARPGETVKAIVLRDGKRIELPVTYQDARAAR